MDKKIGLKVILVALSIIFGGCNLTPSALPTQEKYTEIPTLPPSLQKTKAISLLTMENRCDFPCFLNVNPGKTTWKEAAQILSEVGVELRKSKVNEYGEVRHCAEPFFFNTQNLSSSLCFVEKDGLVNLYYISSWGAQDNRDEFSLLWQTYSPKNIIQKYGVPSHAWMQSYALDYGPGDTYGYILILAYEKNGLYLRYDGVVKRAEVYHVCPSMEAGGDIYKLIVEVNSPDNMPPFEQFANFPGTTVLPIKEAAGISEKELYDLFSKENSSGCFESPRNLWLPVK